MLGELPTGVKQALPNLAGLGDGFRGYKGRRENVPRGVRQTDPPWVVEDRCQAWVAAPLSEQSPNSCLGYPSPHLAWTLRNSSGIGEGIHHSVVQGGREFLRISADCGQ